MKSWQKIFLAPMTGFAVCMLIGDAYAVTARNGNTIAPQVGRAGATTAGATQRMPTMPSMPNFSVGNISMDMPSIVPDTPDNPDNPDDPDEPDNPDNPDDPDNPDEPIEPECPDGGVENSTYTIDNCMDDLLLCINSGALPGGLNDMFNDELRASIVNGMNLCAPTVERCITDVRKDCTNVYRTAADVWTDFNSRKVQPAYYNFVLLKTGLTPHQAENTCKLLDVNTYGSSFNAVSNAGGVTAEYNIGTGAYNNQNGGLLIKRNPQGATLNYGNSGVDGARGHYARWDAGTAECWVRVAAYNKDQQIKNSWLFGAVGNDQPAEVWRRAGDTFTCNRELFGFSLMNQTNTAAVVGIGGGAVVGAGVGAIAGHGDRAFDCSIEKHREMLTDLLKNDGLIGSVNEFIDDPSLKISAITEMVSIDQCEQITKLFDFGEGIGFDIININSTIFKFATTLNCGSMDVGECFSEYATACTQFDTVDECENYLNNVSFACSNDDATSCQNEFINKYGIDPQHATVTLVSRTKITETYATTDVPLALLHCDEAQYMTCQQANDILSRIFNADITDLLRNGEESNMGKAIGIGAGVGAGAGGLATAITAFVERSNISCHVGDNLAQVGYNKSYAIESLKDFYVKWNLNLPDIVTPTGTATDCASWRRACNTVTDLEQCASTQITYKPTDGSTVMQIPGACAVSGGVCMENYPVAKSHGACE